MADSSTCSERMVPDGGPVRSYGAEGVGFEPTVGCPTHAFQACRFGRSRIPPGAAHAILCRRPWSQVATGSCATATREPSQGREAAALSGACGVPQIAWSPPPVTGAVRLAGTGGALATGEAPGVGSIGAMATYQSLYRRYRSQRFDEVLGQDHVTKALRNAVRDGRVGHAYLFSGPRGTGKTSTARILAKVLNCAAPVDGEPCGTCENCVVVAEGRVTDWLLEQDAASKSKVDDMRDLLERVPLGTSGNRKVIILDEVHMLSQGAENALLKTLEEPPEHVVFVLATTDPQKVRPTIRSRTQHFDFKLLPPEVLADHVRRVIADADLGLGDDAVDHVIRAGGGSARDTLSALDQVAALGE